MIFIQGLKFSSVNRSGSGDMITSVSLLIEIGDTTKYAYSVEAPFDF